MDVEQLTDPARAYQDYFGRAIFEPLARHVVGRAAPAPGESVLDVACGTGILTRSLAAAAGPEGHVVGVDINPAMVAVAESLPVPGGARVDWCRGDGTALDLPDAAFDLVCCQQGLQFFPDPRAGVAEVRRVLIDGGRTVIAVWQGLDRHPLYAALAEAELPHLAAAGLDVTPDDLTAPFSLGDADELAALLDAVGFTSIEITSASIEARFADADRFVERMEHAYAGVVPAFAEDPTAFADYLAAISADTAGIVAEYRQGDTVVVQMHTNVALAVA